jgi:hypothetical protein
MASLPPNPTSYSNVNAWASQFYEFYISQTQIGAVNNPQPVLLAHQTTGQLDRAATSGMLMYDPILKNVVYSDGGIWRPIGMDFAAFMAEQEILKEFGDTVSIVQKARTIFKFGNNRDLDIADGFATVWRLGEEAGTENEVFVPEGTNLIDSISSTSAADTTQPIVVEYLTSDGGVGAAEKFTAGKQTVTLNGQTRVPLTVPCARVVRAHLGAPPPIAGAVYIYENTPLTAGKPTNITKAHISIDGTVGETQSFKGAFSTADDEYLVITALNVSINKASGAATAVDYRLLVREVGSVFRPLTVVAVAGTNQTSFAQSFNPYVIVPRNSDVVIVANTDTNNANVSASFQGYLAKVIV